jgi:hypothetical protein
VVIFDPDSDPDGFLPVKNPIELMTLSWYLNQKSDKYIEKNR